MDAQYSPIQIEEKWSKIWADRELERPGSEDHFSQIIPPPNVTGTLHMGHSFQYAIMDFYTRYHHMKGTDSYWQVGTDHAGIATQMVVENNLLNEGKSKDDLGREKFLDEVWKWKEYSEGKISSQMKRLGITVEWDKYRFTYDDDFCEGVNKAFVELYRKDKIYRGYRLVNWDPSLKTAVSDLEVVRQEKDGLLWHISYPLADSDEALIVATTRPETMFGDMAVAVNPKDDRFKHHIGKYVELPFVGRKIPVIGDEYVDMEFGTGCLKITPGHDFNDYDIGKKYALHEVDGVVQTSDKLEDFAPINIFTDEAFSNDMVPAPFNNLDRFKVRKAVLEELRTKELLVKEEKHHISVPRGERSNIVIEPKLSYQWYVKTEEMAKKANEAVNNGEVVFHPANWDKTYFNWMDNIQDWCISRQIWWGHRIPAWHDDEGNTYVGFDEAEVREFYSLDARALKQEEDVLDTWFSASLWPFGSLGWPKETEDFKKFFPTTLLVTGFDIIFFWVARMMMMSLEFTGKVPFKDVYVTGLIRDENGQKMSKSKGNIVNPLDLIDKYGADSLRFTLTAMAAQGRDVKLSESRVQGYRNFGTKIWNASRFCEMNDINNFNNFDNNSLEYPLNIWILNEFIRMQSQLEKNLAEYRFNDAANIIYQFIWGTFCDWYIELIKPHLFEKGDKYTDEIKETCSFILDSILISLHPFMPFITEEIWQNLKKRDNPLIVEKWRDISLTDDSLSLIHI